MFSHSHSHSRLIPIQIETLAGTSFELLVSPTEQIQYIKRKIERREGIPISHQHLIWRTTELEDESCLNDYQIESGTTLKLVLAMRGGPVNTRRVPIEENLIRDMSEYVDNGRDDYPLTSDLLPSSSSNKNVTFLVLRDGDQFNFFQVIDRGDGTLSPLSGSMSATSMYNTHETLTIEPDEKRQADDKKTREKMELIRSKLKTHPRKDVVHHHRRSIRIDASSNISTHGSVPSVSSSLVEQQYRPLTYSYGTTDLFTNVVEQRDSENSEDSEDENEEEEEEEERLNSLTPSENPAPPPTTVTVAATSPQQQEKSIEDKNRTETSLSKTISIDDNEQIKTPDDFLSAERTSTSQSISFRHPTSSTNTTVVTPAPTLTKKLLLPTVPPSTTKQFYSSNVSKSIKLPSTRPLVPLSLSKYRRIPANVQTTSEKATRALPPPMETPKVTIETIGPKTVSALLRQNATIEPVDTSRGVGKHLVSLLTTASTNQDVVIEERFKLDTKHSNNTWTSVTSHQNSSTVSSSFQSNAATIYNTNKLPPVVINRKPTSKCFLCKKKTGLATTYQCRCGSSFCSEHRYPEAHACAFDYKAEGKRLIERNNPLVSAPKLPKI